MRKAICGSGFGLLALASCALPGATPMAAITKNTDRAIILTVRPVPAGTMEYVVRTADGATLAIVQPDTPGLRPGTSVIVIRGERATVAAR